MTDVKPEVQKQITEIIDEYVISHKGNAQCKCIEGARGHLRAKLFGLFDTFNKKHEGAAIIVVCPKCNYPEESCKCVTPEALATALEEQRMEYQSQIDHKNKTIEQMMEKIRYLRSSQPERRKPIVRIKNGDNWYIPMITQAHDTPDGLYIEAELAILNGKDTNEK